MADKALPKLDPNSAPGEDGIRVGLSKLFPKEFSRRILEVVTEVHGSRHLPPHWRMRMLRCIPKDQGKVSVEDHRPITLLTTKVKWITGILKMSMQDCRHGREASFRNEIPSRTCYWFIHSGETETSGVWLSLHFCEGN